MEIICEIWQGSGSNAYAYLNSKYVHICDYCNRKIFSKTFFLFSHHLFTDDNIQMIAANTMQNAPFRYPIEFPKIEK